MRQRASGTVDCFAVDATSPATTDSPRSLASSLEGVSPQIFSPARTVSSAVNSGDPAGALIGECRTDR
jgi:hypothetical protein